MSDDRFGRIRSIFDPEPLRARRVTIIGAGSIGSPIAVQLVRHGVGTLSPGRIRLIDHDVVEHSNLIGQVYLDAQVGSPKVESLASILQSIQPEVTVAVWKQCIGRADISQVVEYAKDSDLLILVADDFEVMAEISDAVYPICPQLTASFGERCDIAEVAFSIPDSTAPLSATLGRRVRSQIRSPQALGCDTEYVCAFTSSIALRLLLNRDDVDELPPCFADAPLFVLGLRRRWIFSRDPADRVRSVVLVAHPK